jgi:UDP:flavonoid glycosyltransferase YjiC (YdhE family)
MRITVLAGGSYGDVLPYLSIADRLISNGHRVRFATSSAYASLVNQRDAEFFSLGEVDPKDVWEDVATARASSNPVRLVRYLFREKPGFREALVRMSQACEDADGIVATTSSLLIAQYARQRGIPVVGCHLTPLASTADFPRAIGPYWAQRRRLGPIWNLMTHEIAARLFWMADRSVVNNWRQQDLGLSPLPWFRGHRWPNHERIPMLFGFSSAVIPRPRGWPEHYQITGYWFSPDAPWQPPEMLVDFLSRPGPVVFIGFGSQVTSRQLWQDVLVPGALRSGARVVIGEGWSDLSHLANDDRVYLIKTIPYHWIFSQVDAVIHHGGAGTAAAALRAAVPSIVVPFTGEQRFWAERLYDTGICPIPANPRTAKADDISRDLSSLHARPAYGERTREISRMIRTEDGIGNATRLIELELGAQGVNVFHPHSPSAS